MATISSAAHSRQASSQKQITSSERDATEAVSQRGNTKVALKQPLQFRRPPAGLSGAGANAAQSRQNAGSAIGAGKPMRRVVSARMQQNVSVQESLQHFIASRSNSVARSSHGDRSQNGDDIDLPDEAPAASIVRAVTQPDEAMTEEKLRAKSKNSLERASKYLRRDNSFTVRQTGVNQQQQHNFKAMSESQTTQKQKPPRSSSHTGNNSNKQVRFDIKEGLRGMIKEQAPAFNAADLHRQLLDRRRQKMDTKQHDKEQNTAQYESQKKVSELMIHDASPPLQQTVSPAFGMSQNSNRRNNKNDSGIKQKQNSDKQGKKNQAILSQTSSSRRYQEVLSSTGSSNKKFAYNLALQYQKEVIESKVRKGEIDLKKLKVEEATSPQDAPSPQRLFMQPQTPIEIPEPISQRISQRQNEIESNEKKYVDQKQLATLNSHSVDMGTREQEKPLHSQRQQQSATGSQRKAGLIMRIRSTSPPSATDERVNHSSSLNRPETINMVEITSAQVDTMENDVITPQHFNPNDTKNNHSMNRTFYVGQIVRNKKKTSVTRRSSCSTKNIPGNSETISISQQPYLGQNFVQNYKNEAFSEIVSPAVSYKVELQSNNEKILNSIMQTSSGDQTLQENLSNPTIILQPPEGGIFQPDDHHQKNHHQSSEYSQLQDSAHFPISISEEAQNWVNNNQNVCYFHSFWDLFLISESDFHRLFPQFTIQVDQSKQALHEPLREDEESDDLSSVRFASKGLSITKHRLHLIRVHLRNVLLDSFMPLILEIIQLRDRLAYRRQSYKLSIKQQLKASIINDICSRLKQKLVLKVLFLQSQFRKNLHSLFSAYLDLLVKKQMLRTTFEYLRSFKQHQIEKTAYLEYARWQLSELRKLQVFDAMRRYAPMKRLDREMNFQAVKILGMRKLARLTAVWQIYLVGRRGSQIGEEMAQRFRRMKLRHQLFAKWVNSSRLSRRIKAKALRLVNKEHGEKRLCDPLSIESDLEEGQSSAASLHEQAQGEEWLSRVKFRSEEIFCRQTQELLLEKEHLLTQIRRLQRKIEPSQLDSVIPVVFDRTQNPAAWADVKPSQALLSNKEQIYTQYPELQRANMTALPPSLIDHKKATRDVNNALSPKRSTAVVHASACELNKALVPPIQKFMVVQNAEAPQKIVERQQEALNSKYSVHEALVAQQNLFGLRSITPQTKPRRQDRQRDQQKTESQHFRASQADLTGTQYRTGDSGFESMAAKTQSQTTLNHATMESSSGGQKIRAVPFKRQSSLAPATRSSECAYEQRVPNQLFYRIQQQQKNQQVVQSGINPLVSPLVQGANPSSHLNQKQSQQQQSLPSKLPAEVQLQSHLRNMITLYRKSEQRTANIVRAKSLTHALREVSGEEPCFLPDTNEGMSLTDFTQVVMQTGLSMLYLNDLQLKYRYVEKWRKRLIWSLLQQDFDQQLRFHVGRAALRNWRRYLSKRKLKAEGLRRTRQMQNFYNLFTRWARANRQLIYETERKVRSFRARVFLQNWRKYYQVHGKHRRVERAAIQLYVRSLLAKSLASMCQNRRRVLNCKSFVRRKMLIKFFKRRWLAKCRSRQLLKSVLQKCSERDLSQERPRYQRQVDAVRSAITVWHRRVEERNMLYKTYLALNHQRWSLLCRCFRAIRDDPMKTRAVHRLATRLLWIGLQKPFDKLLQVCANQNLRAREMRERRQTYICQQFVAHLHAMTVKSKLAKLFVQRKYLRSLQTHIFKHNYVRPLAFREHQLKTKALSGLLQSRGNRWKRQRLEIVFRALMHRKRKNIMKTVIEGLKRSSLNQRRDRIINCTVSEFRKHTLINKSFKLLKFHRMKRHKYHLLNQVAQEFHEEHIRRQIEHGRTQVQLNTQTGCLLNANQALLLAVMTRWSAFSNKMKQKRAHVIKKAQTRHQMLILRCFLAWRSFARYEQSEMSGFDAGGTHSAISYLEVIDDMASNINNLTTYEHGDKRRQTSIAVDNQIEPPQTSTLSYANTELESVQHTCRTKVAKTQKNQVPPIASHSSIQTSYVNTSQLHLTTQSQNQVSIGQIQNAQKRLNERNSTLTQDYSDSTLNNRAAQQSQIRSSSNRKKQNNSALTSQLSSSQLNQRAPQHKNQQEQLHNELANSKNHQHHASVPQYACLANKGMMIYSDAMYQDTSEFASRLEDKTIGEHTQSLISLSQKNFVVAVGRGHQPGISHYQQITDNSKQDLLSINDVGNNAGGISDEQFSYEQVVEDVEAEKANGHSMKGEPPLVTTLKPYNYEFDLPLKQASQRKAVEHKGSCKIKQRSKPKAEPQSSEIRWLGSGTKERQQYATFRFQEGQQFEFQTKHQRVFSDQQQNYEDDDSSVEKDDYTREEDYGKQDLSADYERLKHEQQRKNHFQSLEDQHNQTGDNLRVQTAGKMQHMVTIDQNQKQTILKQHLVSLTISNGTGITGKQQLYDELESMIRAEDELQNEQERREAILRQLAGHYQTRLTSKDETIEQNTASYNNLAESFEMANPGDDPSLSAMEGAPNVVSQSSTSYYGSSAMRPQHYAPDCFVESMSSSQVKSANYLSASFAAGDEHHNMQSSYNDDEEAEAIVCSTEDRRHAYYAKKNLLNEPQYSHYEDLDEDYEDGDATQEDDSVNPMDSHILN